MLSRFLCILAILIAFIIHDVNGQDLMNYANTCKYADHLYKKGNYAQAAIEFERANVLRPNDTTSIFKIVNCYRLNRDYLSAKSRILGTFPGLQAEYPEKFAIEYFKILFEEKEYQEAISFLRDNRNIENTERTFYQLGSLIMLTDWKSAKSFASDNISSYSSSANFMALNSAVSRGEELRYKKPVLAAILSALIPGAGKIYTGNYKDAAFSFLFISTSALLTWRAMQSNGIDVKSGFYGLMTASFYVANIFGSSQSARKYNVMKNRAITDDIHRLVLEN